MMIGIVEESLKIEPLPRQLKTIIGDLGLVPTHRADVI